MNESVEYGRKDEVMAMIKGMLIAIITALLSVLVFALIVKWMSLDDVIIKVVNQIIKVTSIFVGCVFGLKKTTSKMWLKGMILGVAITLFSFLIFSTIALKFEFQLTVFLDIILGMISGAISAIIVKFLSKR